MIFRVQKLYRFIFLCAGLSFYSQCSQAQGAEPKEYPLHLPELNVKDMDQYSIQADVVDYYVYRYTLKKLDDDEPETIEFTLRPNNLTTFRTSFAKYFLKISEGDLTTGVKDFLAADKDRNLQEEADRLFALFITSERTIQEYSEMPVAGQLCVSKELFVNESFQSEAHIRKLVNRKVNDFIREYRKERHMRAKRLRRERHEVDYKEVDSMKVFNMEGDDKEEDNKDFYSDGFFSNGIPLMFKLTDPIYKVDFSKLFKTDISGERYQDLMSGLLSMPIDKNRLMEWKESFLYDEEMVVFRAGHLPVIGIPTKKWFLIGGKYRNKMELRAYVAQKMEAIHRVPFRELFDHLKYVYDTLSNGLKKETAQLELDLGSSLKNKRDMDSLRWALSRSVESLERDITKKQKALEYPLTEVAGPISRLVSRDLLSMNDSIDMKEKSDISPSYDLFLKQIESAKSDYEGKLERATETLDSLKTKLEETLNDIRKMIFTPDYFLLSANNKHAEATRSEVVLDNEIDSYKKRISEYIHILDDLRQMSRLIDPSSFRGIIELIRSEKRKLLYEQVLWKIESGWQALALLREDLAEDMMMLQSYMVRLPFVIEKVQIEFNEGFIENVLVVGKAKKVDADTREFIPSYYKGAQRLKFENYYPIGFSTKRDFEKMKDKLIFAYDGYLRRYKLNIVDLFDELDGFVEEHKIGRRDFSPRNAVMTWDFSNEDQTCKTLYKEETFRLLEANVYSDFVGLDQNNPNGLIQTEVDRKINLITRRHPRKFFRYNLINFGFLAYVHPGLTLSKIDDNNKELVLNVRDRFVNGVYEPQKFASTLQIKRYENFNTGFDLNLLLMDIPSFKSTFYLNGGFRYGRTAIRDSVRVLQDGIPTNNNFVNEYGVNTLQVYPRLIWDVKTDERYSFDVTWAPVFSFLRSDEFEQVDNVAAYAQGTPRGDHYYLYHNLQMKVSFMPRAANTGKLFFRYQFNWQQGYWRTAFHQAQIGYSFYFTKVLKAQADSGE